MGKLGDLFFVAKLWCYYDRPLRRTLLLHEFYPAILEHPDGYREFISLLSKASPHHDSFVSENLRPLSFRRGESETPFIRVITGVRF